MIRRVILVPSRATAIRYCSTGTTGPASQPVQILNIVMNSVSKKYQIPTTGTEMCVGTVAAYRALGVVLQQYVTYMEKEGPSSPAARMAAIATASNVSTHSADQKSSTIASAFKAGLKAGKEATASKPKEAAPLSTDTKESDNKAAASVVAEINEKIRQASYTSLISFVVRTLFSKSAAPLETRSIVDEISDRNKKLEKSNEIQDYKITPEELEDRKSLIAERHFPITYNFRNVLSNMYYIPTQRMVPVLGASGKGLGKEFRNFFVYSGRVSLRFGKFTSGLYPAATVIGAPGSVIGTVSEITNVFELAHPADHVLKATIKTIRVDGTIIDSESEATIFASPTETAEFEESISDVIQSEVKEALDTLDSTRNPTPTATSTSTSAATATEDKKAAVKHPHISVDVLLQVVVPPRRFVSEFDFYDDRVYGAASEGERMTTAKLLALHSATSITRFGDRVYRMFTGRPLKILVANNKTIDVLARQVGATESLTPSNTIGPDGKPVQKYPFETKIVTMVYSFHDKEWAIDNIQNIV